MYRASQSTKISVLSHSRVSCLGIFHLFLFHLRHPKIFIISIIYNLLLHNCTQFIFTVFFQTLCFKL